MTEEREPTYEELKARLARAEAALEALRDGRVDTVMEERGALAVRRAEAREAHLKKVLTAVRKVDQLILRIDAKINSHF
jgi:ABC-type amino acid transport substrate-binding protein